MSAENIVIVLLMFVVAGLLAWVLVVDSQNEDLKGYIERMEKSDEQ